MIKYFGKHDCKQFIRSKPKRFGFKMWGLNAPSGYLVNLDMHLGMNPRRNDNHEELFGKCAAPMINLIEELVHKKHLPYKLYFENLFTSPHSLKYLKSNGFKIG